MRPYRLPTDHTSVGKVVLPVSHQISFVRQDDLRVIQRSLTRSIAALVMISIDRVWEKFPSDHPALFSSPVKLERIDDSVFPSTKLSQEKLEYQLPKEKNDEY
jgi:hypothetical protein